MRTFLPAIYADKRAWKAGMRFAKDVQLEIRF